MNCNDIPAKECIDHEYCRDCPANTLHKYHENTVDPYYVGGKSIHQIRTEW